MDTGEWWTRWTVRVALALYVAALLLREASPQRRLLWTVGCLCYLFHVGCAFEYYHHWSHDEAHEATAQRTAEIVGLRFGSGLYANYAFTLVWLADVVWYWSNFTGYLARPRWIAWSVHGFMGFLAFNATVVFGEGWIRWAGVAACLLLAVRWMYRHYTSRGWN